MPSSVKHTFVSSVAEGSDPTLVGPNEWNDSHTLTGTILADDAASGIIGEVQRAIVLSASAVSLVTTGTFVNITSINLTAGDWDVTGQVISYINGSTVTAIQGVVSNVTGNTTTDHVLGDNLGYSPPPTTDADPTITIANYRVSTASPVTMYLKAAATKSAGTPLASGRISARRIR